MKYMVTHILSNEERQEMTSKGLYCYDLRDSDFGSDIASIEKIVFVNRIGSMITNKEIKLNRYNFVDYNTFTSQNKAVYRIEELLQKNKDREVR